jgi:cytoskeletal protein RodZ
MRKSTLCWILGLVVVGALAVWAGWLNFSNTDGRASMTIDTNEVKQDTQKAIDKSKELIDKAKDSKDKPEDTAAPSAEAPPP